MVIAVSQFGLCRDCSVSKNGHYRAIIQHDAIGVPNDYDPRGIQDLTSRFRRDMDLRWDKLGRKTFSAISGADLFGIDKPVAFPDGDDKLAAFERWFSGEIVEAIL